MPEPNRAWVTDVTYVSSLEGWLYLAAILDLRSRRVVCFRGTPPRACDARLPSEHESQRSFQSMSMCIPRSAASAFASSTPSSRRSALPTRGFGSPMTPTQTERSRRVSSSGVVEDAGAPVERRVGAALAIQAGGDADQKHRVRIAAAGCAHADTKACARGERRRARSYEAEIERASRKQEARVRTPGPEEERRA